MTLNVYEMKDVIVLPFQILMNLTIAFVWMFMHDAWDVPTFITGYVIGLLFIFLLRRFFPADFYVKKVWAIIVLLYVFTRELVKSSILVIRQVTRPTLNITPGIFKVETELNTDLEVTILSCLISLTPGSVVMEVASEGNLLYVHAMDIPESQQFVLESKAVFEAAIMEVTR